MSAMNSEISAGKFCQLRSFDRLKRQQRHKMRIGTGIIWLLYDKPVFIVMIQARHHKPYRHKGYLLSKILSH